MTDYPRVSTVLRATGLTPDLGMVDPATLERARARGQAVHEAAEALAYSYFDADAVPPDAAPYVSALQKFLSDSGFEPIAAEVRVIDPVWRFQGHPDLIGWLHGIRTLIDLKTGASDGADVQVAAYVQGWTAEHPDQPITAAAILHLREDGTYRYEEVELPHALPIWHAALTVFHAQHRRKAA